MQFSGYFIVPPVNFFLIIYYWLLYYFIICFAFYNYGNFFFFFDFSFHLTVFQFFKNDWDSFRFSIAKAPLWTFLKNRPFRITSLMCKWITFKTFQKRSNSHSKCAAVKLHRNYFYVYHRKPWIENHTAFKTANNRCKSVLEN